MHPIPRQYIVLARRTSTPTLVSLANRLPKGASIVSTVHDEVIVEAPEELANQVLTITRTAMIESMAELFPGIPIVVEGKICQRWGEK